METRIQSLLKSIDTSGWKTVNVEFGRNVLPIAVPPSCLEVTMKDVTPLSDPKGEIEKALNQHIGSPPLE